MGFYLEENCQTEAHEPLLDWASGRKAPVVFGCHLFHLVMMLYGVKCSNSAMLLVIVKMCLHFIYFVCFINKW